jgi:hypothetical protein
VRYADRQKKARKGAATKGNQAKQRQAENRKQLIRETTQKYIAMLGGRQCVGKLDVVYKMIANQTGCGARTVRSALRGFFTSKKSSAKP